MSLEQANLSRGVFLWIIMSPVQVAVEGVFLFTKQKIGAVNTDAINLSEIKGRVSAWIMGKVRFLPSIQVLNCVLKSYYHSNNVLLSTPITFCI